VIPSIEIFTKIGNDLHENYLDNGHKWVGFNENSLTNDHKELKNITINNHTYWINSTDSNPECKPECYLNCQVHFPDPTEQKFCVINVCKCVLKDNINLPLTYSLVNYSMLALNIEKETSQPNIPVNEIFITPGSNQNVIEKEKEDRHLYNILMIILLIFLVPALIYFTYEMYKNYDIADQQFYDIHSINNDQYSLIETQ